MAQNNTNTIDLKAQLIKAMGDDISGRSVYASIESASLSILETIPLDHHFATRKKLIECEIGLTVALAIKICHENSQKYTSKLFNSLQERVEEKIDNLL